MIGNRLKRLIGDRRGASLIMVLSVLMAVVILAVSFSLVATVSAKYTFNKNEYQQQQLFLSGVADAFIDKMTDDSSDIISELNKVTSDNWQTRLSSASYIDNKLVTCEIYYLSASRDNIALTLSSGGATYGIKFKLTEESQVVNEMKKIYDNTFFFEGSQYFSGGMKVTGNIFLNGDSALHIAAADSTHNGNVISCGNLEINAKSIINGDVVTAGNLILNDSVKISGKVTVGGNITVAQNAEVVGEVTAAKGITLYGKISGLVMCAYIDAYSGGKLEGQLCCEYIKMWGAAIDYNENSPIKNIITSQPKIGSFVGELKLPQKIQAQEWEIPTLTMPIVPSDNIVSTSGKLAIADLNVNKDIIFDTKNGDLHIVFNVEYLPYARNMMVRGSGRVFLYIKGQLTLSGHIGLIEGFTGIQNPSECKIFFISSSYASIKIANGGRLDGYVYLSNGEFTASGNGRAINGGKNYKIVGSITSKTTIIENDLGGEIVFARPNLDDIIFNDEQNTITDITYEWNYGGIL